MKWYKSSWTTVCMGLLVWFGFASVSHMLVMLEGAVTLAVRTSWWSTEMLWSVDAGESERSKTACCCCQEVSKLSACLWIVHSAEKNCFPVSWPLVDVYACSEHVHCQEQCLLPGSVTSSCSLCRKKESGSSERFGFFLNLPTCTSAFLPVYLHFRWKVVWTCIASQP